MFKSKKKWFFGLVVVVLIGVIFVLNSKSTESVKIYRYVSPFGEKLIEENKDIDEIRQIIDQVNKEIVHDNDLILTGPVYLIKIIDDESIKEYGFFGSTMHYVEIKNNLKLMEKWYESNENNLMKIEKIYYGDDKMD